MNADLSSPDALRQFISENWPKTIIRDDGTDPQSMGLPCPYVIPCIKGEDHFQQMYYWDTYFTLEGAALDGHHQLVEDCAQNFMHIIEHQGFIPNVTKKNVYRSQPPNASFVYKLAYAHNRDKVFLRRAVEACIGEHAFWMSQRQGPDGLNTFGHHYLPMGVGNFYWQIRKRCPQMPEPVSDRRQFLAHKIGEAESGWDFSPRFRDRALDIYACDLNALLCALEMHIAEFMDELGDLNAPKWRELAAERKTRMDELLWNPETGFYHDYDFRKKEQTPTLSGASHFALWCGVPDEQQAAQIVASLPALETPYGLLCSMPDNPERVAGVDYQWDAPNGWAPLHFAAIAGCLRYGFKEDARRIAGKWVDTIARNFAETGNLWEKYNMAEGTLDVVNEYGMPPLMGWTAGVTRYALNVLEQAE